MLPKNPTAALGVLVIGEAPNYADTFNPNKGYLTYDFETDPTGRFMRTLLVEEGGLADNEICDVLFGMLPLVFPAGATRGIR